VVNSAAPNRVTSFIKKPCISGGKLGVVTRKLVVTHKTPAARTLPSAEARGEKRRVAINAPIAISTTPMRSEAIRESKRL
jgi:hypothetical protein